MPGEQNSVAKTPERTAKLCPIMSIGSLARPASSLMLADGGRADLPQGTPCQGELCQLWLTQRNAANEAIGGGCAFEMIAIGAFQQAGVTQNLAAAIAAQSGLAMRPAEKGKAS